MMAATDNETAAEQPAGQRLTIDGWRDLLNPGPILALIWSLSQIAVAFYPYLDTLVKRSAHVGLAVGLALILTSQKGPRWWRWLNVALAVLALTPALILWLDMERILDRFPNFDPLAPQDYFAATVLILLSLEAGRRIAGYGLTLLAGFFILYYFTGDFWPGLLAHRSTDLFGFVEVQILSVEGLLGIPTGVSVDIVFYFILFAAVFEVFGGGRMIIDLALSITGRTVGGPAKAAVVSSGMMGSVSGSAVANVMSTGIFTIPLMIRVKYRARFAGAVEAVASTGGQIVPPVMGAAAFIMADFLRVPYSTIVLAALVPALLYFTVVLLCVDLEARANRLTRINDTEVPGLLHTLRHRGVMLVPLIWLGYRIVGGHNVTYASVEAIALTIIIGTLNPSTRQKPIEIVRALLRSAERGITVALPCALAGVIVAVVTSTGLGPKFTSIIVDASGGILPLTLILAMIATIILGAGMPTSSAYIMGAILIAPALIRLGLDPIVAHFFALYFAILSMLTPPVALSSYAAATISGESPAATGWTAFRLAIPGFLIPFGVVLHPGLVMVGSTANLLLGVVSLLVGFMALAPAIIGWLFRPLRAWERAAGALMGLVSILPYPLLSIASLFMIAGFVFWLWQTRGNGAEAAPAEAQAGL